MKIKITPYVPDEQFLKDNGVLFPRLIINQDGSWNFENYKNSGDAHKLVDYLKISGVDEFLTLFNGLYHKLWRIPGEKEKIIYRNNPEKMVVPEKYKAILNEKFWEDNGILFPEIIFPTKKDGRLSFINFHTVDEAKLVANYFKEMINLPSALKSYFRGIWLILKSNHELDSVYPKIQVKKRKRRPAINTVPYSEVIYSCRKPRFIPSDQFLKDNGILFPEVLFTKSGRPAWDNYTSLQDVQKIVDYMKDTIHCKSDLNNIFCGLAVTARSGGFIDDIVYPLPKLLKDKYKSVRSIQKFIDDHPEIECSNDFKLVDNRLYNYASNDLKCLNKLVYPSPKHRNWDFIESPEDVISFIRKEKLLNSTDLRHEFPSLERKIHMLEIKSSEYIMAFVNPFSGKSYMEAKTGVFLLDHGIKFDMEATFDETGLLRFDFWLPDYNLILEPGGDHHFISVNFNGGRFTDIEKQKNSDREKFEFCQKMGYKILYCFDLSYKESKDILNNEGYMGEYYTNLDEYFSKILEIVSQEQNKGA